MVIMEPIDEFVKRARKQLGLKQDEFGALLGVSRWTIMRLEERRDRRRKRRESPGIRFAINALLAEHEAKQRRNDEAGYRLSALLGGLTIANPQNDGRRYQGNDARQARALHRSQIDAERCAVRERAVLFQGQ
jgi:DNA-binding XRE family transcriptional regulator